MQAARVLALAGPERPRQGTLCLVLDTDEMVARCQRGDETAFRQLFAHHRADVARLVHRMAGPNADLEDIVQEVFVQVHRSLGDFRGQAKFSTWLHRVAVNVVLMYRRARRSRPELVSAEPGRGEPDARIGPDEDVARRERMRAFWRVLERLPEKKRTVFVLHEIEGMAPAEIAQIVRAPILTVRTRLFYARRALSRLLRDEPLLESFAEAFARKHPSDGIDLAPKPLEGTR